MFAINDKVIYPGHGIALIARIFEKKFGEQVAVLFELKFIDKDMTVMVPINKVQEVGIRRLSSEDAISTLFSHLIQPAKKIDMAELSASNWNKRSKGYHSKLQAGSLKGLSEVYFDLSRIAKKKGLSFGEKALLHQTENLIAQEIAHARHVDEEAARNQLRVLCNTFVAKTENLE